MSRGAGAKRLAALAKGSSARRRGMVPDYALVDADVERAE